MNCEICGAEVNDTYEVELEGATMFACRTCARGKHLTGRAEHSGKEAGKRKSSSSVAAVRSEKAEEAAEELVDDYGMRVRKAREGMGLPIKVLAEKISETEGMLQRVENQKTQPNDTLARKLEKELGIRLFSKPEAKTENAIRSSSEKVTLLDFLAGKKGGEKEG